MNARPNETNDKPLTIDEVFHPWELLGQSPRDCQPDRGRLLLRLSRISILVGGLSFLYPPLAVILLFLIDRVWIRIGWFSLGFVFLPVGMIGFVLGSVIGKLARHDLDAMTAGYVDQRGYYDTEKARRDSHAGAVVSLLGSLFWYIPIGGFILCIVLSAL